MNNKCCRMCNRWVDALYGDGLCWDCSQAEGRRKDEERDRERQRRREREEDERQRRRERQEQMELEEEHHEEMMLQAERHQQELLEQAERHHQEMLDATLPWITCEQCGESVRKDKLKHAAGMDLCEKCADKVRTCKYCKKKYVMDKRKVFYTRVEDFDKGSRRDSVYHTEYFLCNDNIQNENEKKCGEQYDGILRNIVYMCPECLAKDKETRPDFWETSHKLKKEYDLLKSAREEEIKAKERAERLKELQKQKEVMQRQLREREELEKAEAKKRKKKLSRQSGCMTLFLFAIVIMLAPLLSHLDVFGYVFLGVAALSLLLLKFCKSSMASLYETFLGSLMKKVFFGILLFVVWCILTNYFIDHP